MWGVKHLLSAHLLKEVICFNLHTNPMIEKVLSLFYRQGNRGSYPRWQSGLTPEAMHSASHVASLSRAWAEVELLVTSQEKPGQRFPVAPSPLPLPQDTVGSWIDLWSKP